MLLEINIIEKLPQNKLPALFESIYFYLINRSFIINEFVVIRSSSISNANKSFKKKVK